MQATSQKEAELVLRSWYFGSWEDSHGNLFSNSYTGETKKKKNVVTIYKLIVDKSSKSYEKNLHPLFVVCCRSSFQDKVNRIDTKSFKFPIYKEIICAAISYNRETLLPSIIVKRGPSIHWRQCWACNKQNEKRNAEKHKSITNYTYRLWLFSN